MLFKRLITSSILLFSFVVLLAQGTYEWKHLGPFTTPVSTSAAGQMSSTGMGWVESLWVSEDQQTIYAGTITSGIFKSEDAGQSWKLLILPKLQYGALDFIVDKNELFMATGLTHYDEHFGIGLIKSTDAGETWDTSGLSFKEQSKKVLWAVERINKECILAASPNEVFKSVDNGNNWITVLPQSKNTAEFRTILVSKHQKKHCFAAGNQLYRSKDAGDNWDNITKKLSIYGRADSSSVNLQRIAFCEDPNIKKRYLALYNYGGISFVDETRDGGNSWNLLYSHRKIQRVDINHAEIAVAPGNSNYILLGGVRAYLSKDGGQSFEQVSFPNYNTPQFAHDDIRALYMVDSLTYYMGTDGGVVKTTDAAKSWQSLNGYGLTAMMAYGIGLVNDGFVVGCQDLGSFNYSKGNWTNIGRLYGDGGDVLQIEDKVYTMMGGSLRVMSSQDFASVRFRSPDLSMRTFTSKLIPHSATGDSLFLVSDHLWFFNGKTWNNLTESIDNHGYKATAVDVNDQQKNRIYFAFDQPTWGNDRFANKFWRSDDAGKSWTNLTKNLDILKWRFISSICTNPNNENEVYLSLGVMDSGNGDVHKVYKSTDGGLSWVNWSEGLPIYESFKITFIKGSKSALLYSCIDGLYYRSEKTGSWIKISKAVPSIAVRDFEIDYTNRLLYLSTYGNGVWQLPLTEEMLSE